jgi:uncharacterized protein (DUF1778 family)
MSTATAEPKKPLGVRVTAEQHKLIAEAARLEHRSINSFVLQAAVKAAESVRQAAPRPKRTIEEIRETARLAQEMVRQANPTGRSLVDELIAERRQEAMRE